MVDGRGPFPDPASRFQPQGPHGPSEVFDPTRFEWSDSDWNGVGVKGQVLYEVHIGTFTREGTWEAACQELAELAAIGVTVLEVMPVADFPGRFGWGYDGVDLFAPTRLYGVPDTFRRFVNQAHCAGLGVILDVVYNHLGPDGNYLRQFARDYFSTRYHSEWGDTLNFDGPNCGPVREYILANVAYWIQEFHLDGFRIDEGQRETSLEKMATLKTLSEGGRLTAAVASQISDGASAVLLASEQAVKDHKLTPRARIHHISARGADPVFMLTGPIPATRYALEKTGLSIDDIDVVEINEAFAPVVLAWLKEIKADPEKVNPNGGAIALGHPLGATGAKLFTTMLNELERIGGRYGLQTMCEGGGTANVTIIERL